MPRNMAYVDANVFVYKVILAEDRREAALSREILLKIARREISAYTASLTWDELVWAVRRVMGAEAAKTEGERFLRFPNLKILNVDGVLVEAQRIMSNYNLHPRDAIHAACAVKNRLKKIVSDDADFDRIEELERIPLEEAARW